MRRTDANARLGTLGAGLLALLLAAPAVRAEGVDDLPPELEGIGIEVKPDAQLPLDAVFKDEEGHAVNLRQYFSNGKPTLLVLAYFRCPMLCGLVLNATVDGMKGLTWTPGDQFQVVTVSIDPRENPELAAEKKKNLLEAYGRPQAAASWHFLTGGKGSIDALADAIGFHYRYLPERNDFAHAAGIFVVKPDGRLSRTITGLLYEPRTLRLSLVEAADGKVGSVLDQVLLYCFHYDPTKGVYTPIVMNMVRLGGVVTVLLLGGMVTFFLRQERRAARLAAEAAAKTTPTTETISPEPSVGTP